MPRGRPPRKPQEQGSSMYFPPASSGPGQFDSSQPPVGGMHPPPGRMPQHFYDAPHPGYGRNPPPFTNGQPLPPHGPLDNHYNAMGGPSRLPDYHPYPQPVRSSPLHNSMPIPMNRGPPSSDGGWSSVHPGAPSSMPPPRNAGVQVKLEDLVSQNSPRTAVNGHGQSTGPGGLTSVPLNVAQLQSAEAKASASGDAAKEQGPSEFIKKLYKMLEEESVLYGNGVSRGDKAKHGAVGWGKGGVSFVVWEMNEFTTKVLPQTFRHSNFSSFVRQLNKYGFSKIKHVDHDTGQIRENVWEFQHPNFQAGGKSDLDSIKRKAVVPKKGGDDREVSPARGLGADEVGRMMEMESRIGSLEEKLAATEEALIEARNREIALMGLMRNVISQLGHIEKESPKSVGDEPTPRIMRLFQSFDQVAQSIPPVRPNGTHQPISTPFATDMFQNFSSGSNAYNQAHISPHTDGSSRSSGSHHSPNSRDQLGRSRLSGTAIPDQEDIIELDSHSQPFDFSLGNNMFPDTAWFNEMNNPGTFTNPRKSSDDNTLKLMAEALASQNAGFHPEPQDPLDNAPQSVPAAPALTMMPTITQSPFGTLIIPPQNDVPGNGIRLRRSTVIKPSWTQTPKILVVEDDVVYRQLSRRFLEKFGCQIEVVENAQVAIERMNKTKYDLVLMDIFFGPNMDGRKATSLIRQFDMYTPIISMTSNAQPQDVDSYIQSGMTDILAKPFTKHGLFGILDKHLIHLKAIQLSGEVPRFIGVPPLSDQGVVDAVVNGAAQWTLTDGSDWRNPLVGMGWSDETYQMVLQQFMHTGVIPDVNSISNTAIGTNLVFGGTAGFNRKRSIESPADDWSEMEDKRDHKRAKNLGGIMEMA